MVLAALPQYGMSFPVRPAALTGVLLPSPDNDVAMERIELDCPATPPGLLGGDDRRAVAGKRIEDDGTAPGATARWKAWPRWPMSSN
jgi:hypothetical protein